MSIAFQELKEELELQDKTVTYYITKKVASITISDEERLELEYELDIISKDGKEVLMNIIQYPNADGMMVRKVIQILQEDGSSFEPMRLIPEMMINDILDKYRSTDPFSKVVMSPYSVFHE